MRFLVALLAASVLACAQTPATKLITPVQIPKKPDNSVGGTLEIQGVTVAGVPVANLHAGQDYINALVGNVSGKTIWRLGNGPTNYGFLSLSNGTGAGGFDGNGAQIYGDAFGGLLEVMQQIDVGFTDPRVFIRPGQLFTTNGAAATVNNIDTTGISTTVSVFVGAANSATILAPGTFTEKAPDGTTTRVSISNGGALGSGLIRSFDNAGTLVNTLDASGLTVGAATGAISQLTNTVFTLFAADGTTPQVRGNNSAGASTGGMIRTYDISGNVVNTFNHLGIKSSIFAGSGTRCLQADNNGLMALAAAGCASAGANTALSNLASTAVNVDILPGSDNAVALGSSSLRFAASEFAQLTIRSAASGNRRFQISGSSFFARDGSSAVTAQIDNLTGQITSAVLAGGGTQCLNADNSGVITGTGSGCGGGFTAGAWTSYTPSTAGLSSVTVNSAAYNTDQKVVVVRMKVTGTPSGGSITFSLPASSATDDQAFACTVASAGAFIGCNAHLASGVIVVNSYNNVALPGSALDFYIQGIYEKS